MTPATSGRPSRAKTTRPTPEAVRTFRLTVMPTKDAYGISIDEQYGHGTLTTHVMTATAAQTQRVIDAVIQAVKDSGHAPSVLALKRHEPIPLEEAAGVRLSLVMFASQPVSRNDRIRAMVTGVNAMSIEETYYWYAKCVGPNAGRARKALRMLLADDRTDA